MNVATLQDLCAEYQRLLRMQDWVITVKYGKLPKGWSSTVEWRLPTRMAVITIITSEVHDAYKPKPLHTYDPEQFLVHELIHVRFETVDVKGNDHYEFAIDATADALVALRRQCQVPNTAP